MQNKPNQETKSKNLLISTVQAKDGWDSPELKRLSTIGTLHGGGGIVTDASNTSTATTSV